MAYNYYQPLGYAPAYGNQYQQMQQIQQPQMQPTINNTGILWVDGYNEAAMYPVAPNAAVVLWDKAAPVIYLKKADVTGKPFMQTFDLVERKNDVKQDANQPAIAQSVEFATKTDLRAISDVVDVLQKGFEEMRLKIENKASESRVTKDE